MALVPAGVPPPNSQTPLSADYWARGGDDLYSAFAAGLTLIPESPCAPGPSAFPGLPGAAAQAAAAQQNIPIATSALLPATLEQQGQQGAGDSSEWQDAADVLPMGTTASMVESRTGQRRAGSSRRSYSVSSDTQVSGVPWGGAAASAPHGGCAAGKLSLGAKLLMLAGAVALGYALLEGQ